MKNARTADCYDCGKPVSFSAIRCLHCGSREPLGSPEMTYKAAHSHRIEERNDRNLIVTALCLGVVGGYYGWSTSSSTVGAVVAAVIYGLLGLAVGAPLGFAANLALGPLARARRR